MSSLDHDHPFDPDRVAAARAGQLSRESAERLTAFLGLLGDPVRARILTALAAAEELCVGDIAVALGVNEDTASYGLRVLRASGLVLRRREGRMAFYRLIDGDARESLETGLRALAALDRARGAGPAS